MSFNIMPNEIAKDLDSHAVHKLESSGLINRLQDETHHEPKSETLAGVQASLSDWKGHLVRDSAGAAAGFTIGKFGDVYAPFARKVPWIVGSAVAINLVYDAVAGEKGENHSKDFNLGKFGTDVLSTATAGLITGRLAWGKEGAQHLDYLALRDGSSRYVPAHKSVYGPKIYSFGAHTEYTGLTMGQKTRDVREFLKDRRQLDQLPSALERMKAAHNPNLEGRIWTSKRIPESVKRNFL